LITHGNSQCITPCYL